MSYFTYFPDVQYRFGDEQMPDVFQNISVYATIVDEIKDNVAFYQDYYIKEFERADNLSYKLYNTPNYHWTFYLMNNHIRERGWPLNSREIIAKAERDYNLTTLTTLTSLVERFRVGQSITGNTSGATGIIEHRHLDLGQLVIKNLIGTFINGETISSTNSDGVVETIVLVSTSPEYLSAHHYENAAGEYVDIDPTVGPGALLTEITYLDRLIASNDELKSIKILKPSSVTQVVKTFREAIRS